MPHVDVPRHRHFESFRSQVPAGSAGAGVVGTLAYGSMVVELPAGTVVGRTVDVVVPLFGFGAVVVVLSTRVVGTPLGTALDDEELGPDVSTTEELGATVVESMVGGAEVTVALLPCEQS